MFRRILFRFPKKRLKVKIDRLSSLPDCILANILTHLDSTKECIRTDILSKRWQHLWSELPNLVIKNHDDDDEDRPSAFYSSVFSILSNYGESQLIKFKLDSTFIYPESIYSCISYAVDLKVQEFDIRVWNYRDCEGINLPVCYFNCSSFIHLKLFECYFEKYEGSICWNNLRTLSITFGRLNDYVFRNIMSGCPVLETLVLDYCSYFEMLDISSESVKNLVISNYSAPEIDCLNINAPYIHSLTMKGLFDMKSIVVVNMMSLIQVNLNFSNFKICYHMDIEEGLQLSEDCLKELIITLSHVKELNVGHSCLEVLATLQHKGFICPSNLKVSEEIHSS